MASVKSPYSPRDEQKLMTELWDPALADDLEKFVLFTFPWGKSGTPLANKTGPRSWQRNELQAISDHIKNNRLRMELGDCPQMYRSATASGRGVGKSALTSWLNIWMMTTRLGSTCVNAANTEQQLKTRTWAELGKWHTLAINSHWFEKAATSLKPAEWFEQSLKKHLKVDTGYYYSQAQLWSEENPDAFAGIHNHNGVLVIFDEASGIPAPIWQVTEGFFTDPVLDRYWFTFSNPRRNVGAFFSCFHEFRQYWRRTNIDSRTVEGTDKELLQQIVDKHGEDSDAARVEVKGEFPRQGDHQFISRDIIENAANRDPEPDSGAPLIIGVDPARYGDDSTVIWFRQGRDARSIPAIVLKGKSNMEVVGEVAHWINKTDPDAVCVDAGSGAGIIDRLRELHYKVHEVWFGGKSEDQQWFNKRTELWDRMRDWLGGGSIPNDVDLRTDLAGPEYKFQGSSDKIMLQSKEEMKSKGMASPDRADALALTFSINVPRRDMRTSRKNPEPRHRQAGVDYEIFS